MQNSSNSPNPYLSSGCPGVQEVFIFCPGVQDLSSGCPGRQVLLEKALYSFFYHNVHLFSLQIQSLGYNLLIFIADLYISTAEWNYLTYEESAHFL